MSIAYYAIIHPDSKYARQNEDKVPFPVYFESSVNGYHWVGNGNQYRDVDLVRLVPVGDNDVYSDAPVVVQGTHEEESLTDKYESCHWFKLQENQCHSYDEFKFIRKDGMKLNSYLSVKDGM